MKRNIRIAPLLISALLCAGAAQGGELAPPDGPGGANSSMYTLDDLYNRLNAGTAGTRQTFAEPLAGPTVGAMRSLNDIMGKAPAKDDINGATAAQVLFGKTFWGLRTDGTWGLTSGTAAAGASFSGGNGLLTFTIPNGLYSGNKSATAADTNLDSGNIKSGATIFGVAGSTKVMDTSSGTATAANILTGKTAFVNGAEVTGTLSFDGTRATASSIPPASKTLDGTNSDQNPGTAPDTETVEIRQILGGVTTNTLGQIVGVPSNYNYSDSASTVYSANVAYPASLSSILGTTTIDPFTGLPLTGSNTYSPAWFESSGGTYRFTTDSPVALRVRSVMSELLRYRNLSGGGYSCTTGLLSPLGRWCDNNNGTVRDMSTGLVWLKDASWGDIYPLWANAFTTTNAFDRAGQLKNGNPATLTDGSVEGDWGLPTLKQLKSLITGTEAISSSAMYKFTGVQADYYWSSSTNASSTVNAWYVYMVNGLVNVNGKTFNYCVWPVRGGQ